MTSSLGASPTDARSDTAPAQSYAYLSFDGAYRYFLGRLWPHRSTRTAVFVMLNPSTADAEHDDPTIRRCIGFAKALNCQGLLVVNLYAFRATKPADLWKAVDPIGPENDDILRDTFAGAGRRHWPVIAAWGANADPQRAESVRLMAEARGVQLKALGLTKAGAPRHPLYLPATAVPQPWAGA